MNGCPCQPQSTPWRRPYFQHSLTADARANANAGTAWTVHQIVLGAGAGRPMKQHERGIISSPRQEAEVARVETQLTTSNIHVRLRPAVAQTNRSLHEKHGKQAGAVTVETARIAAAQHRLFHRVRQVWPMSTFIKYLIPMAHTSLPPRRHLNWFSRLGRDHRCTQHSHTWQITKCTTSVATGRLRF